MPKLGGWEYVLKPAESKGYRGVGGFAPDEKRLLAGAEKVKICHGVIKAIDYQHNVITAEINGKSFTLNYQEDHLWRFNDKIWNWVRASEGEFQPGRTIEWYVTPEGKVVAVWWWWVPADDNPENLEFYQEHHVTLRKLP